MGRLTHVLFYRKERLTASPFLFNIRRDPLTAGCACNGAEICLDGLGVPAVAAHWSGGDRDQHEPGNAGGFHCMTVSADLSSLIPGTLPFQGVYHITGTAEARLEGQQ